jgi:hypothetical protein
MMEEVWGKPETEQQDLADLEDSLRDFFAKHKAVRQVILAPKCWFKYFSSKMYEPMLQLLNLKLIFGRNLKFPSTRTVSATSRPTPQILIFRLCYTEHPSTARRTADVGTGTKGGA